MRGVCSPHDLRTTWTLSDVLDYHEALAEQLIAEKDAQNDSR